MAQIFKMPEANSTAADSAATGEKSGGNAKSKGLIIIAIVLLVLVVLVVAAEMLARFFVPKIAEDAIRSELELPDNHPVTVQTSGVLLPQLASGALRDVTVDLRDYKAAPGVVGSAKIAVSKVALDPTSAPLGDPVVTVSMSEAQFQKVLTTLAPEYIDSAEVRNDAIVVHKALEAFGQKVPAHAVVKVGSRSGNLLVEPQTVSAAGITVSPDSIQSLIGGPAAGYARLLSEPIELCVADRIPKGLTLRQINTQRGKIAATLDADPEILMKKQLREPGTC